MPEFQGLGVKVARHGGPEFDPDHRRSNHRRGLQIDRPQLPARPHPRPGRRADRFPAEVCLYTVAPDDQFQVDFLPGRPDVIVASPCSGHGFKFSCLIGRVLADLAVGGRNELPVGLWKIAETRD